MTQNIFRFVALGFALTLLSLADASAQIKYVALGDSLTAGWQSGCLVQRNQVNSYPAVLARQFGVTDFEQPLVQETALTDPMGTACLGAIFIPPATISVGPVSQMGLPLNLLLPRPYDNLGLPGAEVKDLIHLTHGDPDGTDLEKISALVLRNVTGSPFDGTNAVQQADALIAGALGDTTIVSLWIGNNNVLGASTSGIVVDGVTLTSAGGFRGPGYPDILAALLPADTFVAANIPDVTSIPFSTTIPPILVNPSTRQPVIINGSTVPLLGQGDSAYPCTPVPPDHGCGLPPGSLVNLPASALLGQGIGIPVAAGRKWCSAAARVHRPRRPARRRHALPGRDGAAPGAHGRVQLDDFILGSRGHCHRRERSLCEHQGARLPGRRTDADDDFSDGRNLLLRRRPSLDDRLHGRGRRVHPGDERVGRDLLPAAELLRRSLHAEPPEPRQRGHRRRALAVFVFDLGVVVVPAQSAASRKSSFRARVPPSRRRIGVARADRSARSGPAPQRTDRNGIAGLRNAPGADPRGFFFCAWSARLRRSLGSAPK